MKVLPSAVPPLLLWGTHVLLYHQGALLMDPSIALNQVYDGTVAVIHLMGTTSTTDS